MRNITRVRVEQVIVHVLEPKAENKIISQRIIPLKKNSQLANYLAKHIELSLADRTARAARFKDRHAKGPATISKNMIEGKQDLVSGSKRLAELLYPIMEDNLTIADGDLAICIFYDENSDKSEPYLALIKLDPIGVFRNTQKIDDQGNEYVDLEIDPYVFAKDSGSLQKGAYIRLPMTDEDYDMLLVDKQAPGVNIAHFFIETFLESRFVLDSAELTRLLYITLIEANNELRPTLQPDQDKSLGEAILLIFQQLGDFNWRDWVTDLKLPQASRGFIEVMLKKEFSSDE